MRFRTFQSVVADICTIQLNDSVLKNQARVARALRNVMSEMSLHVPTPVKTEYFKISSAFTIVMPLECTKVTKVGVMCQGRLKRFGRNELILRPPEQQVCACSPDSATTDEACTLCTFHNVFHGGKYGEAYAYRSDPWAEGEYRYDDLTNTIYFSGGSDVSVDKTVLVEYSMAEGSEALNMIPGNLVNMLSFRVASLLQIPTAPMAANVHNREFERSYEAAIRAWNNFTPTELIAALMGESMAAPK